MSALPARERFLNREIQWLEFNRRVLSLAADSQVPLLERLRFLGIFTSNLDEFVMKRVGGLKRQVQFGLGKTSLDGLTASEQLALIRTDLVKALEQVAQIYKKGILPELAGHKILLKKWKDLDESARQTLRNYYQANVFPVLTPLVVDPALPFPFISNLSLSLAIKLENKKTQEIFFGRVKVPPNFPPWILAGTGPDGATYVSLLQVISHNLQDLFPDMNVLKVMPFRITRNADLDRDEEGAEDLLELISEEIRQRRFAEVVRLEVGKNSDPWMIQLLQEELEIDDSDTYQLSGLLDYRSLGEIADLPLPHLRFPSWDPVVPPAFQDPLVNVFDSIKKGDILVHHPYENFTASVERFIREASRDDKVLAIKMTLYRTNEKSAIISSLIEAAEQGKQVVCLVELKARFDEERNIFWAQQMEKAGIHVVYGVIGFKTHCKTVLVLRQEQKEIVAYSHIGTGNYNSTTAKVYTDFGLFTANPLITQDVVQLFHFLTGRSFQREFKSLLVAPMNMKTQFLSLIEREIKHSKKGKPAHIVAKFNSLEDQEIIEKLYQASQNGVEIDLIVRGFSCLRPQVKGLSERIRVVSVVGRFLEHSRVFFFRNAQEDPLAGEFFIGSADWMRRNLHARVEVVAPILDRPLRRRLWEVLQAALGDKKSAWHLDASGSYSLKTKKTALGSQEELMRVAQLGPLLGK